MSRALVIDDNRDTADTLVEMLNIFGINADAAYGSSPAMARLKSLTPILILLDVNMPGVDGLEILGYLKREPRLMKVPVVVITSDDQPETRERVFAQGANAMLIKPTRLNALQKTLMDVGLV